MSLTSKGWRLRGLFLMTGALALAACANEVPPPNTQVTIGQSPACTDGVTAAAALVPNTACIIFNSRGLPVDRNGALFPRHAFYVIGQAGVYATTVTATPLIRSWRSQAGAATWTEI